MYGVRAGSVLVLAAAAGEIGSVTSNVDVAIVGGGIIGMATAMTIAQHGRHSVVVLEAERHLAAHQSGHNSGVIHSGLYYRPGSRKARDCVWGRDALYRFCEDEGLPYRRRGKLVVATRSDELPALRELERRGRANGLRDLRTLDAHELHELEPAVAGTAGLWVPETGVVDFAAVTRAFAQKFERAGGQIRIGAQFLGVARVASELVVRTTTGEIRARLLVGCAGLQADRVARLCGVIPDVAIIPFRGEYYEVTTDRRHLVRNLIYPVPDPDLPFLGVHLTRTVDDHVEAGPNAILALKREGYGRWTFSLRDVLEMIRFPGFRRMATEWWRTGVREMRRSLSKARFAHELQKLVPEISATDLKGVGSGVRAQAVDRSGRLLDDFHVLAGDDSIHLLNAPSPAATASLSIGRGLAEMVESRLGT
jgi:L-2-hydroxyglutarate oxidase